MASPGRDPLGDHYEDEHLTYEEVQALGAQVVTEDGRVLDAEELRGRIFRIRDRGEPSGYVVTPTETTGTTLCFLRPA